MNLWIFCATVPGLASAPTTCLALTIYVSKADEFMFRKVLYNSDYDCCSHRSVILCTIWDHLHTTHHYLIVSCVKLVCCICNLYAYKQLVNKQKCYVMLLLSWSGSDSISAQRKRPKKATPTDWSVSIDSVKQSDFQVNIPVYFIILRHIQNFRYETATYTTNQTQQPEVLKRLCAKGHRV